MCVNTSVRVWSRVLTCVHERADAHPSLRPCTRGSYMHACVCVGACMLTFVERVGACLLEYVHV